MDDAIRGTGSGAKEQYVLKMMRPLREIPPRDQLADQTLDLFQNECEGICGV